MVCDASRIGLSLGEDAMHGRKLLHALIVALTAVAFTLIASASGQASASRPGHTWVGSWEAAPVFGDPGAPQGYVGYSLRNVIHLSVGGSALRVHLSNGFGNVPLPLAHATVALATGSAVPDARPGTMRDLTFGGRRTTTIAANAEALSDPVQLKVDVGADLLVTTYVDQPAGLTTTHQDAQQVSFFTISGDHSADVAGTAYTRQTQSWYYVDGVDVLSSGARASVVALGDSITDGFQSTVSANHRWPDYLARRLQQLPPSRQLGVLNAGISANRVLLDGVGPSALARLDRDALSRTGVRTILLLEGINDIDNDPPQPDATAIEQGLAQIAAQARAAGLRVIGCTLTPYEGSGPYTSTREIERETINTWIRTSHTFDRVVDFDAATRDPADPLRLRPSYDSGDHLHPNDAGYQAMAAAIP